MSNLPTEKITKKSDKEVNQYFGRYFTKQLSFASNDVDAVVGFFVKRGFQQSAAIAVSSVLLEQAKIDDVKIFAILDTLKGLNEVQLSAVVTEIMNYKRAKTSSVGYRRNPLTDKVERRNVRV